MTARPQLPDRTPRTKGVPTALDGLLVVDFTRVVAGPACTQTLADFGAEVIKIENPDGGDDTRSYEHADLAGESAAYISLNRNKRGIVLDFTKPEALCPKCGANQKEAPAKPKAAKKEKAVLQIDDDFIPEADVDPAAEDTLEESLGISGARAEGVDPGDLQMDDYDE